MKTNVVKGTVGGALILLIALGLLFGANPQSADTVLDNNSSQEQGTKAYFLLLKKIGYKTMPLTNVSLAKGQAIALNPDLDEQEATEILDWVKNGNSLIVLSPQENSLFKQLPVKYKDDLSLTRQITMTINKQKKWDKEVFAGVKKIKTQSNRRFTVSSRENEQIHILAADEKGPWLIEIKWGKGKVLLLSEPYLLTNKYIGQADNVVLGVNIIQRGSVKNKIYYFSSIDKVTGMGPVGTLFTERWPLLLLQASLLIFLLFYGWGKRFGQIMPLPEAATDFGEYATSLANLYRYTKGRIPILDILNKDFQQALLKYLGLPLYTSKKEMVAWLKSDLRPESLSALKILADTTDALKKQDISEHKLFSLARQIEQWRRENENGSSN